MAEPDRKDPHLHGREPERERSGEVLDQDPDEALERADQRPVDHHRRVLGVVGALVAQAEALRHLEVELHRPDLPGAGRASRACAGRSSARRRRRRLR